MASSKDNTRMVVTGGGKKNGSHHFTYFSWVGVLLYPLGDEDCVVELDEFSKVSVGKVHWCNGRKSSVITRYMG